MRLSLPNHRSLLHWLCHHNIRQTNNNPKPKTPNPKLRPSEADHAEYRGIARRQHQLAASPGRTENSRITMFTLTKYSPSVTQSKFQSITPIKHSTKMRLSASSARKQLPGYGSPAPKARGLTTRVQSGVTLIVSSITFTPAGVTDAAPILDFSQVRYTSMRGSAKGWLLYFSFLERND